MIFKNKKLFAVFFCGHKEDQNHLLFLTVNFNQVKKFYT